MHVISPQFRAHLSKLPSFLNITRGDMIRLPCEGVFTVCRYDWHEEHFVCTNGARTRIVLDDEMMKHGEVSRSGGKWTRPVVIPSFAAEEIRNDAYKEKCKMQFKPAYAKSRRFADGGYTGAGYGPPAEKL